MNATTTAITTPFQRLRELEAEASPAPWRSKRNHSPYKIVIIDDSECYTTLDLKAVDANLIAESRNLLPYLLASHAELLELLKLTHGKCRLGYDDDLIARARKAIANAEKPC